MKKTQSLYFAALVVALSVIGSSCKKPVHSNYATPSNYRLLSYTKVTSYGIISPPTLAPTITENYTFFYDGYGRVSQIIYTSNDSNLATSGHQYLSSNFSYVGPVIMKTTTQLKSEIPVEIDSFTQNANSQVTNAYFGSVPSVSNTFSYNGKLLTNEAITYNDSGTTITANLAFTANNGDLYQQSFDGNYHATFPDSGIRPIFPVGDPRDTILVVPLVVTWVTFSPTPGVVNHNASSKSDVLNTQTQYPVSVYATDGNNIFTRTCVFPISLGATQSYDVYKDLPNRVGDYLQLESFSIYGSNIYNNSHLIKTITTPYYTTTIVPTIDADSKITQNVVTTKDLLGNVTTIVYSLQYQTF